MNPPFASCMHTAVRLSRAAFPLFSAIALALASHVATAQDTGALPTVTVVGKAPRGIDTPTSTGSNLDITPLQTPASIEIITQEQLRARGDASLTDAITRAAGISSLAHPGNSGSALSVRGFIDASSVMRLYDGTRQYGGVGVSFPFDTWSVERIEVLRGPASVIHGDGAIGGVVNVIPKKPQRGPVRNEVQATVGTDGQRALAFDSTGALSEALSYRVGLSADRSDGWVDRGDSRNLSFSGALRLDASPDLSVTLSHAQGEQHPMRYFGVPLIEGRQLSALRERNYNVADGEIKYEDRWTELAARWTPTSDITVRSKVYGIQSKRHWRNVEAYEYDASTRLIDRSDSTEITHDQTQLGNTTDAAFKGILFGRPNQLSVGVDVNTSSFTHTNNTYTGDATSVDPFDPVPGLYSSAIPFIPRYRNKAEQVAVFLEDRLELTPRWSVVAGLRHDRADVSRRDLVTGTQAFATRYSNTGWRLGTVFQLQPTLSLYAQYAEAADPVSGLLMLSPANSGFDLSHGRQLELGLKQAFWEGRGDWTLAVYDITKNKLLTRDPQDASRRLQVGQRSSTGIEATLTLAVTKALQLDANAAVLKARYDDFREPVGGTLPPVSRNGNVPTDVPEQVANVWLGWKFMPDWTASGGLRHVGRRYADNANTLKLPAYTTTDLSLQWRATKDTTLALRGFNVFDKAYFSTAYYTTTQWLVGEGRRVELALNHRF